MAISRVNAMALLEAFGVYMPEGVTDGRLNNIAQHSHDATLAAIRAGAAEVREILTALNAPVVAKPVFSGPRFSALKSVIDYVIRGGNHRANADALLADAHFTVVSLRLAWDAVGRTDTAALRVAWPNVTAAQRTGVSDFARSRTTIAAVRAVSDIAAVHPGPVLTNLQTLGAVCAAVTLARPGDPTRFAGLTADSFADIAALFAAHPPNGGFPGFTDWGPGNHGARAANVSAHFLKHVCSIGGGGAEYREEFADWWRTLRIELRLADVEMNLAHGENTADVRDWFYAPNQSLADGYVTSFIENRFLSRNPHVLQLLVATYEAAYADYAIRMSRRFTACLVQSNGQDTYVSGYRDDLFVIGRRAAGALGISSAYFTRAIAEKWRGARANLLWYLISPD